MITLSTSGSSVIFTFSGNSGYLQDGTIEVPVNSLSLITDESGMATFRKSASNDIFISARYEEFGMTKAELEAWYKENMVGETGGGGGVDSGTVQTMIDESISGLAESSAVTEEISAAVSGKIDSSSAVTNVRVLTVSAQNQLQIEQSKGNETGSTFVGIVYTIGSGLTWNYQTKNIAVDSSTVALKSDVSGKVDTDTYSAYTAATDARILEDEEVTAAGLNSLNDALSGKVDTSTYSAYTAATDAVLSGKQDTLSAGTNITIVDNVISAEGGGGMTEDDELLLSTALTDLNDRKIDASEVKANYQRKGDYATKTYVTTALEPYETKLDEINTEEVASYALNDLNERLTALETAVQALQALHNNE